MSPDRLLAPAALPGSHRAQLLEQAGYVQEEYLLSGIANLYRRGEGRTLEIERAGIPYTTRLLLVRPRDPSKFSGTVQLTFNHPLLASDSWDRIGGYAVRHGDAVAILQIGGDERQRNHPGDVPFATPLLFKWFDADRYAAFNWPEDDGIRWDVISQAVKELRQPQGPLAPLEVRRLYMSGHSYLGAMVRTFITEGFHDRMRLEGGRPAVDGYLIQISPRSGSRGLQPLTSRAPPIEADPRMLPTIDVPVIDLTSEFEALYNRDPQRPDHDPRVGGYRLYELGGVSHTDLGFDPRPAPVTRQLAERGHPGRTGFPACPGEPTDIPMRDVTQAALANLERWTTTGEPPPRARRLMAEGTSDFRRDRLGNPVGGIRVAQLEVPIARYSALPASACEGDWPYRIIRRFPLPKGDLDRLYPAGKSQYLDMFRHRIDELVRDRWLLPDAAARELHDAEQRASAIWGQ